MVKMARVVEGVRLGTSAHVTCVGLSKIGYNQTPHFSPPCELSCFQPINPNFFVFIIIQPSFPPFLTYHHLNPSIASECFSS